MRTSVDVRTSFSEVPRPFTPSSFRRQSFGLLVTLSHDNGCCICIIFTTAAYECEHVQAMPPKLAGRKKELLASRECVPVSCPVCQSFRKKRFARRAVNDCTPSTPSAIRAPSAKRLFCSGSGPLGVPTLPRCTQQLRVSTHNNTHKHNG